MPEGRPRLSVAGGHAKGQWVLGQNGNLESD